VLNKMNKSTRMIKKAIVSLCVFTATAHAQTQTCESDIKAEEQTYHYQACDNQVGWFIGGQLGYAVTDVSQKDINYFYQQSELEASSINVDDADTSTSVFVGYQFNTHWALEAAYIDLGEREVSFTGATTDRDAFYDNAEHVYPQSADGLSFAIVGSWPFMDNFKLSGKLGYWHWKGDYTTFENSSTVGDDSVNGNDLWLGAELNYRLSERTQLYVSAQRFRLERDNNNAYSLGIRYYFGDEGKKKPVKSEPIVVLPLDSDKDGVLDLNDSCPDSNIAHQVDTKGCVIMAEQLFEFSLTVYFANNSSDISSEYQEKIKALSTFITEHNVEHLKVYGHTSAPGSKAFNLVLSQQRAESVSKTLVEQFGIDSQVVEPIGLGETKLLDSANTEKAHALNRRIELSIVERLMQPLLKPVLTPDDVNTNGNKLVIRY